MKKFALLVAMAAIASQSAFADNAVIIGRCEVRSEGRVICDTADKLPHGFVLRTFKPHLSLLCSNTGAFVQVDFDLVGPYEVKASVSAQETFDRRGPMMNISYEDREVPKGLLSLGSVTAVANGPLSFSSPADAQDISVVCEDFFDR